MVLCKSLKNQNLLNIIKLCKKNEFNVTYFNILKNNYLNIRQLSTTKCNLHEFHKTNLPHIDPKYGGTSGQVIGPGIKLRPEGPKTVEDFATPNLPGKNWYSLGFDEVDQEKDVYLANMVAALFVIITYFLFLYVEFIPDFVFRREWIEREARLLLEYRSKNGLPYIDLNYVDPKKIVLPSEEELEGIDIHY